MKYTGFLIATCVVVLTGCATTTKVDFSNLSAVSATTLIPVSLGDVFYVGTVLIEPQTDTQLLILPYNWGSTTATDPSCAPVPGWTAGGYVSIEANNMSGGSGNELHFNNASLGVIVPGNPMISDLKFKFGDHGGSVNLIMNGTLYVDNNFKSMTPPPGVAMTVTPSLPLGNVQLSGSIDPFYFSFPCPALFPTFRYTAVVGGGQELWIDDIEFTQ